MKRERKRTWRRGELKKKEIWALGKVRGGRKIRERYIWMRTA